MIRLEIDGTVFEDFIDSSANESMLEFSKQFSFSLATSSKVKLPFSGGETVAVFIDDQLFLSGTLEKYSVSYDDGSHTVDISGRDFTADISDSDLLAVGEFTVPITLERIIEKVIAQLENDISVKNNSGEDLTFDQESVDLISIEDGMNAYEFIRKYALKKDVLLSSDADGNISIEKTNSDIFIMHLQNSINDIDGNNILSASIEVDRTNLFNKYYAKSELNVLNLEETEALVENIVDQQALFEDNDLPKGRQVVIQAETSSSNPQLQQRAEWESILRRSGNYSVNVELLGHSTTFGEVYQKNKKIFIQDDFLGLSELMMIESVEFINSSQNGNITNLVLVNENSFTNQMNNESLQLQIEESDL